MNNEHVQSKIEDFLDGQLSGDDRQRVQHHIDECTECQHIYQQEQAYRQLMREHPVPAASQDFEQRLFAPYRQPASDSHRRAFIAGFGSAIAAAVVLFVLSGILMKPAVEPVALPQISLTLYEAKKVNLVFDVPEAVADATFSMQLPGHVEIAGYPGHHNIEWQASLNAGKNLLSLPVVAQQSHDGELVATIRYGKQKKVFRLNLKVNPVGQTGMMVTDTETV